MSENLPANAGDVDLIPGLGRFQMPRSSSSSCEARAPQPLSLHISALLLQLLTSSSLEPVSATEAPPRWEACSPKLEKTQVQQWRPSATKNKIIFLNKLKSLAGTSTEPISPFQEKCHLNWINKHNIALHLLRSALIFLSSVLQLLV